MGKGMRIGFSASLFAVAAMCFSAGGNAAGHHDRSNDGDLRNSASKAAVTGKPIDENVPGVLGRPAVFRGTLGDMPVQFSVRQKVPADEGIEGEYFIFGQSRKILLAGELDGENIFLEESENGTNISGSWDGKLKGDVFQVAWTSADDSVTRPFSLKLIPLRIDEKIGEQKQRAVRKKTPAANAASAASR